MEPLAVAQEGRGDVAPDLDPALDAPARADDDLGVGGPHLPHGIQRCDSALRPALARLRRLVAVQAANVAVGHRPEALCDIAVVLETAVEQVGEDGAGIAGNRDEHTYRLTYWDIVYRRDEDAIRAFLSAVGKELLKP